jgi:chromosome partitioning protein
LAEGAGAKEYAADSLAANEMARLWIAIEKSVKAITGVRDGASMHRAAA